MWNYHGVHCIGICIKGAYVHFDPWVNGLSIDRSSGSLDRPTPEDPALTGANAPPGPAAPVPHASLLNTVFTSAFPSYPQDTHSKLARVFRFSADTGPQRWHA